MTARRKTRLLMLAAACGAALLIPACGAGDLPQNALDPEGPIARKVDNLFDPVFWIAVGVFVVVEGLLLFIVFRFRQRSPDQIPTQVHGNKVLEIAWTIAPSLLLFVIAFPTVAMIFELAEKPDNALEVTVTGHQWWWEIRYPDLGVVTANELHIPINQPVYLTIKSVDVIHSFWVPKLAGKQDMIPGRSNHLTIIAEHPERYLGQCAEFCGVSHANMRFRVMAQEQADFDAWVEQVRAEAATPADDLAQEGARIFAEGTWPKGACVGCHTIRGVEGAGGRLGPELTHFGSRTTLAGGTYRNTPENLARWLRDPNSLKPGALMPTLGLTDREVEALVAYLQTLE